MMAVEIEDGPITSKAEEWSRLGDLSRLLQQCRADELTLVGPAGEHVELPDAALRVLRQAVDQLARDRVVTVRGMSKELTLDQAEDLLDIPRLDLAQILDRGVIPSWTKHGRRRVWFDDVMKLKRERDTERRTILRRMTQEGQAYEDLLG